ncbi:hypothetical protein OG21DRAFT_760351 [Imleria badia]|nr:hypothetical protein OG21DRAFT_760351 [Imleria badia]
MSTRHPVRRTPHRCPLRLSSGLAPATLYYPPLIPWLIFSPCYPPTTSNTRSSYDRASLIHSPKEFIKVLSDFPCMLDGDIPRTSESSYAHLLTALPELTRTITDTGFTWHKRNPPHPHRPAISPPSYPYRWLRFHHVPDEPSHLPSYPTLRRYPPNSSACSVNSSPASPEALAPRTHWLHRTLPYTAR